MARIVVFIADLDDVIARTDMHHGLRWANEADRDTLIALGLRTALVDWVFSGAGRIVVVEEAATLVACNVYLQVGETKHFDWLTIRTNAQHNVIAVAGFVRPENRGKALLSTMKGFAARYFLEHGYRRMISLVAENNQASFRTQTRVGARPLVTLSRVRMGGLTLVWKGLALRRVSLGKKVKPYLATI